MHEPEHSTPIALPPRQDRSRPPATTTVALQDLAGNDMASFTETATNNPVAEPVPALPLAGLGLLGLLLALLGRRRQGG